MDFKIDTKEIYTTITPANGVIDAKMTDALGEKIEELRQSGSKNYMVDLSGCNNIDESAFDGMLALHENCYNNEQSLVFLGIQKEVMKVLREADAGMLVNTAPTEKEAVDIISMEILERDLFNEES